MKPSSIWSRASLRLVRALGLLSGVLAILDVVVFFGVAALLDMADPHVTAIDLVLLGALGLAFFLFVGVFLATIGHRWRRRKSNTLFAPRLQGIEDWYVRGDLVEPQWRRLRDDAKALLEADHGGEALRTSGSLLLGLSIPIFLIAAVLASASGYEVATYCGDDDCGLEGTVLAMTIPVVVASGIVLVVGVVALVTGARASRLFLARFEAEWLAAVQTAAAASKPARRARSAGV